MKKRAESRIGDTDTRTDEQKPRMECGVCWRVYDPAEGDPDNKVPPNTPFENLPGDWVCPICGATKDQFAPAD